MKQNKNFTLDNLVFHLWKIIIAILVLTHLINII